MKYASWSLLPALVLSFATMMIAIASAQDADTLTIDGMTYRLDGIDAPEVDQVCLDGEGKEYACGREAWEALAKLVAGQTIQCEDVGPDTRYPNRRIGRCSAQGIDVNKWLVQQGWAVNFEPYAKGRFKADEDEARNGHFGIWRGCFVAPRDFRRWSNKNAALHGANCPDDARRRLFPDDPKMPPGCEIKGKYSARAWPSRGIYHTPGCGSYRRTKSHERWFCSEDDALASDFRKSFTCWW